MGGGINNAYCTKAPVKVTAVALYDDNSKEYFVYVLDEAGILSSSVKNNTNVIPCKTEKILLQSFLDKWIELDVTVLVTWNGDSFDIPYLYNRMRRVLGQNKANQLSPIGIVKEDQFDMKAPFKIAGVNSLDYLRLYRKFIPKQQPSYALDAIATAEIGKGKIKYEGTLDNLFRTDIDKFIAYNVNDVQLIVEIDEKKKFIDLAIMVASIAHVPYHYVYETSRICEGAIMCFLKKNGIVSVNKPTTTFPELKFKFESESEDDEKFPGAWVLAPTPGLERWVLDCDLESLYPCIIKNLNIGTESYLGRIVTEDNEDISWGLDDIKNRDPLSTIQIESNDGKYKYVTIRKLISLIEENDILISPNGVMFDSYKMSAVCSVVSEWFTLRKTYKGKMISAGKAGDHKMEKFYDIWQAAIKVCLNAIYGSLGLTSFRYGDPAKLLAIAVTMTGRSVNQGSIKFAEDKFNKELGANHKYAVMADTDSAFYKLEDILLHRHPDLDMTDDEKVMEKIRLIAIELPKEINEYYLDYSRNKLNRKGEQYFRTKSEVIYKRLYISGAKQYAAYMVEKEGIVKAEFSFVGLDFIKSSYPRLYKEFTQQLVKDILFDKPKSYIDTCILDFREKFKTLPLEEAAKPTGMNKNLKDYIQRGPAAGTIFSTPKKGAQAHFKAAFYYNDLLNFKGLADKHYPIQTGEKFKWVYLKKNEYNIDVLGFNLVDPPEEIMSFIRKYMDREMLFDKNLVNKLQRIYSNLGWGIINYNKNVHRFIRFL